MVHRTRHALASAVLIATAVAAAAGVLLAQDGPVAAMFRDDMKRRTALASSFVPIELPAAGSGLPLHVYLSAGDLERAFDRSAFRPDAAIVPTNTGLALTATFPSSQRVLAERVSKQSLVMADLQDQIATLRRESPAAGSDDLLQIGTGTFLAQLPRSGQAKGAKGAFPRLVCLVATDFAAGGAIDHRELFSQDRMRKGVAGCLAALDSAGAGSVVMSLLGAASAKNQSNDPLYEGQRLLQECRQLNAAAGIALGIHDFAPGRRAMREIGIVQWDQEITDMFRGGGRVAQIAYRLYAEQIKTAVNRGIAGDSTTANDLDGNCATTFNAGAQTPGR